MRFGLSSHNLTNILIVTSWWVVRNLGHECVLNESTKEFWHLIRIHSTSLKLGKLSVDLRQRASVLGPPVSIDKLVAEAWNIRDRLRKGLRVIVNITLIEDVGSAGRDVDILLELVEAKADGITSGLALLRETLVVFTVVLNEDNQLRP